MFPQSILAPWTRLFASLALEVILVFALTALLARLVRSASGQRMVWRMSFVALGALVMAECSGVGHSLLQQLRASPPASVQQRTFVVTTSVPDDTFPISARMPTTANVPVAPAANSPEKLFSSLARRLPFLALAGLIWFGARRSFGALRLIRLGRRTPLDSGDLAARVQALGRRLGIRRHVRVKSISGRSSPIAFGIFRPTVGVPMDFSVRFTAAQQDAMLAHELAHIAAFDAVWMLLADLVTALLWWHPGAWWARRHLRAASETAADEASLLLDDGPATLAECLVTLGDLLTRSPDPGGLGMAGFRFRSELGRRVERLLHLRGPSRHPWCGASAWLARLLVPCALLGLALAFTAWLLPPAAGAATLREALQRSPLGLATTALLTADANDASRLLLQGKQLYDAGKTNEAEAKWRTALELDPSNKVALDYLANFSRTNLPAAKPAVQPSAPTKMKDMVPVLGDLPFVGKLFRSATNLVSTSKALPAAKPAVQPSAPTKMKDKVPVLGDLPFVGKLFRSGTNLVSTSNARQRIYQKLHSIRLESVKFDDLPLNQVLEQIMKEALRRDPEKKGINIIINSLANPEGAAPTLDPATGLPMAGVQGDINTTTIKIDPKLYDVTLGQALDIIVKVADRPIKYSVEDYGVFFALRGQEAPVLHTRWYKLANTFMRGLQEVTARDFGSSAGPAQRNNQALPPSLGQGPGQKEPAVGDFHGRGDFLTTPSPSEIVGDSLRTYFRTKGVTLDPPKSIILSDRLGRLMVRATLEELDVIEQAVAVLNTAPPQVHIEVKFCEVPESQAFDFILQPTTTTNKADTNAAFATRTGVLTPEQYRHVIRALEQRQGVTFLAAPNVTTPTGRQAQLKTVEVKTIVTGFDASAIVPAEPGKPPGPQLLTEQFELGPVVDIVPSVAPDRRTIHMTVIAGLIEFVGYDHEGATELWNQFEFAGVRAIQPEPPRPVFRERQAVSRATLWDGQTLVLASRDATLKSVRSKRLAALPEALVSDLSRRSFGTQGTRKKSLLVFLTPTIVDPAGNAIHTDADLPERTKSVPSQLPPPRN